MQESESSSSLENSATKASDESAVVVSTPPNRDIPGPHPFSAIAIGLKGNTLGIGFEAATPLARRFNLRAGFNLIRFGYTFNIDGVTYASQLHLGSGTASIDWFPTRHGFHISPGIMYARNTMSAVSSVPPGQYFELGSQGYTNSIDDPLNGTARVVFPRNVSPMLTLGFGNMIPHTGRHFSFPFEFGVAYTGAATIDMTLNGTACTYDGCFTFAENQDAQQSLREEIAKLNEKLKRVPIYPIASFGVAYRF